MLACWRAADIRGYANKLLGLCLATTACQLPTAYPTSTPATASSKFGVRMQWTSGVGRWFGPMVMLVVFAGSPLTIRNDSRVSKRLLWAGYVMSGEIFGASIRPNARGKGFGVGPCEIAFETGPIPHSIVVGFLLQGGRQECSLEKDPRRHDGRHLDPCPVPAKTRLRQDLPVENNPCSRSSWFSALRRR